MFSASFAVHHLFYLMSCSSWSRLDLSKNNWCCRHPRQLVYSMCFPILPRDDLQFCELNHLVPVASIFSFEDGHRARLLDAAWYSVPRLACAHGEEVVPRF
jgi:hypothetical protein